MKTVNRRLTLIPAVFVFAACATPAGPPEDARSCPAARPEACTMEYRPVIGYNAAGEPQGEFSNACVACTEAGVTYTVPVDRH